MHTPTPVTTAKPAATLSIVTGASRGLGLAIARQLLRPHSRLLVISRNISRELQEAAAQNQTTLEHWLADLADASEIEQPLTDWLGELQHQSFGVVQLINNAGVIPPIAPLSRTPAASITHGLRVGLEAAMILTGAFLRGTEGWQHCQRKVLNISSGLGRRALASQTVYCAAKAGMDHFTRCLAQEEALKPYGAKVCALAPGVIDTDMQRQLRSAPEADFPGVERFAALHQNAQLQTPQATAQMVLNYLNRPDFGQNPVADVREP